MNDQHLMQKIRMLKKLEETTGSSWGWDPIRSAYFTILDSGPDHLPYELRVEVCHLGHYPGVAIVPVELPCGELIPNGSDNEETRIDFALKHLQEVSRHFSRLFGLIGEWPGLGDDESQAEGPKGLAYPFCKVDFHAKGTVQVDCAGQGSTVCEVCARKMD